MKTQGVLGMHVSLSKQEQRRKRENGRNARRVFKVSARSQLFIIVFLNHNTDDDRLVFLTSIITLLNLTTVKKRLHMIQKGNYKEP